MNNHLKIVLAASCAATGLLAWAGQALAQDEPVAVEEIVVTAQKRAENLRDVPAAVTAITAVTFQEMGAARLDDYVARIPGLTVSNVSMAAASTQLTIRGITTGPGGNPTVGVYVDESPFGSSTMFGGYTMPDLDPQDLARVEVLRGPQGTLYGAGAMGGLLKYVTAAPDPTRMFGRIQVDGSTTDGGGQGYGLRGAVNLPLGERLALRLSAYDRTDPGYVDNVLTGEEDVNETRVSGGRAALGFDLNDDWKVKLSAIYQHQRGSGPVVDYDPVTFQPVYGDLKQWRAVGTGEGDQKLTAYNLVVEGRLGDFATLTWATGYDQQRMNFSLDYTSLFSPVIAGFFGIPDVGVEIGNNGIEINKFVQEVRLTSPTENQLSWQVGVFYTRETQYVPSRDRTFQQVTGAPVGGLPVLFEGLADSKFEEKAVFGDVTYRFTDAFDVTAGLRYGTNTQRTVTAATGLINGGTTFADVRSEDNSLTWLINPRLKLGEDTMVYGRFATGYRPGGPNTGIAGTPLTYGPDEVTNYELGIKSSLLDRTVSVELAAYWIDWKDIQVQQVNTVSYIGNGGTATSRGFEATGSWRPSREVQLYANATYQDSYLTSDFPAGGAVGLKGDRLPTTPLWSGAFGGDWRFPLTAEWTGHAGFDWRLLGRARGGFPNPGAPRFQHQAYDVLDLRLGASNERFTLTFFAKNIGDDRGQTADLNLGLVRTSVIQPRTFAVSLSAKF